MRSNRNGTIILHPEKFSEEMGTSPASAPDLEVVPDEFEAGIARKHLPTRLSLLELGRKERY
jgi:hypothetical protein